MTSCLPSVPGLFTFPRPIKANIASEVPRRRPRDTNHQGGSMSAFKQKARMLAVRAGLLAGASAAVLAISGVGASSAFAAAECPNNAVQNIEGKGSSLQKEAQKFWTGREV